MQEMASDYREKLLEALSDIDEDITIKYLEGEEISEEEIKKAIRKGCVQVKITPVFLWLFL